MSLPSIMSVMVFPYIMTAIRRCRGGIQTILAQHVAGVGQPGVEGAKPVRHSGGEVRGTHDRQSCGGKQQDFHLRPHQRGGYKAGPQARPNLAWMETAFRFPPHY